MEQEAYTDAEVVGLSLKDGAFFGVIVERYEAKLDRYIRRIGVRNDEDRLDVLQEIFIKVYRNLNSYDQDLSFSSWIYRIAHNEAISWFRKQNVRPEGHLVEESNELLSFIADKGEGSDDQFDSILSAEEVRRAVEVLDEKYRDVIILRFFEYKDYDEISDILKIPIGSVGTLLHRAKGRLKTSLNTEALNV